MKKEDNENNIEEREISDHEVQKEINISDLNNGNENEENQEKKEEHNEKNNENENN